MISDVTNPVVERAVFARHSAMAASSWCWSFITDDPKPMPGRCIERIASANWLRTGTPIISICVLELMTRLEGLREHDRIFGTLLSALDAASAGPHARAVRDQHAQLVRGRARTRSAINQISAELRAQRVRRLLAACAPRGAVPRRRRLVATRSVRNTRSSCKARRAARVGRAVAKATGDPDPDPESPGADGVPVHRTRCAVGGDNTKNPSEPSVGLALEHARPPLEPPRDRDGKGSLQPDEEASEELLERGTVAYYIIVSRERLSQGHDVHDAVDASHSRGVGASSSTGPSTGVSARAEDPCRETHEGRADRRIRRWRRGTPRATVRSWPEPS